MTTLTNFHTTGSHMTSIQKNGLSLFDLGKKLYEKINASIARSQSRAQLKKLPAHLLRDVGIDPASL